MPIAINNSSGAVSLTVSNNDADVFLTSGSPVSIVGGATLGTGNLSLQTSGAGSDISVASAISASNSTVTLDAGGSVILNQAVTDSGGTILITANNGRRDHRRDQRILFRCSDRLHHRPVAGQWFRGSIGGLNIPVRIANGAGTVSLSVNSSGADAL